MFIALNLFFVFGTRFKVPMCISTQNALKNTIHTALHTSSRYILDILHAFKNIGALIDQQEELAKLRSENQKLHERLKIMQKFKEENISLHSLLSKTRNDIDYQSLARVVLVSSHPYLQSLVVERGKHNLQIGQAAITQQGLIGLISEVQGDFVYIQLINDLRSHIPVTIGEDIQGVLSGSPDGIKITAVSSLDEVKQGLPVKTSSNAQHLPSNIPIGTITHKTEDAAFLELSSDLFPTHVMILPAIQQGHHA